jgi:hypothetical protein
MVVNREKDSSDFLVPENILSRELRIFMSFNSRTRNWKVTEGDPSFCNENNIKNSGQFRNQTKRLNTYAKKFIIGPPLITRFSFYELLLL